MVDAGLYIAYGLTLLAAILALGFPLVYMAQHPKEAKGTLIGVAVVAVIFIIAYAVSSGDYYFSGIEKYKLTESDLKLIGAGLNTFLILAVIAIGAAVYSEVSSIFK